MSDIAKLESEILSAVSAAGDEAALEAVRVAALGKKGSISELLGTLGKMTPDERKAQGPLINGLKDRANAAINAKKAELGDKALDARLNTEAVDVTLPVREAPTEAGRVHPISQVIDELTAIFADMGFAVAEGPDIETDDYNFTKLNFTEYTSKTNSEVVIPLLVNFTHRLIKTETCFYAYGQQVKCIR
jgi:phenylalanyl-tRNA synthetase alpha chain